LFGFETGIILKKFGVKKNIESKGRNKVETLNKILNINKKSSSNLLENL